MKVLITGAGGFIGQILCPVLEAEGFEVTRVIRGHSIDTSDSIVCEIGVDTDWMSILNGVDVVVHLAARAHVMKDQSSDPLCEFRATNVEVTQNLALQAAKAGVYRLIYLSSIKVNGGSTDDEPFTARCAPDPDGPYGISKWEAEAALRKIENDTGLEVVVIRPTLVYGPGVKGNIHSLISAIRKGIPLPLSSVRNKRDLVSVYNICDLIEVCIQNDAAAGRTFLVSDGEPISTTELVHHLAAGVGKPPRLISFPVGLMTLIANILGLGDLTGRLFGNLQVSIEETQEILGWAPPFSVAESFQKMFQEQSLRK